MGPAPQVQDIRRNAFEITRDRPPNEHQWYVVIQLRVGLKQYVYALVGHQITYIEQEVVSRQLCEQCVSPV